MKLTRECVIDDIMYNAVYDVFSGEKIYGNVDFSVIMEKVSKKELNKLFSIKNGSKVKITLETEDPVLDDKEREYLKNIIKPFRNRVRYIVKLNGIYKKDEGKECIHICLYDDAIIGLPVFKKGTMYKGMKINRYYYLEELGL